MSNWKLGIERNCFFLLLFLVRLWAPGIPYKYIKGTKKPCDSHFYNIKTNELYFVTIQIIFSKTFSTGVEWKIWMFARKYVNVLRTDTHVVPIKFTRVVDDCQVHLNVNLKNKKKPFRLEPYRVQGTYSSGFTLNYFSYTSKDKQTIHRLCNASIRNYHIK